MTTRNETKSVHVGSITIGGGAPIAIQSMTNTPTADVAATVAQIHRLEAAGCEIVRVTVPDEESARAIEKIKEEIHIPLVADIHFDWRMAIAAMERGADKIRINPGNIGDRARVQAIVGEAKRRNVPIRVGVNSGSIAKDLIAKYGTATFEALTQSALDSVKMLESMDFDDIVVSLKSSDWRLCVDAYLAFAAERDYPLHLGITEAGGDTDGLIKSSMGLGAMLYAGIGDTIRVSLTGDPVAEVIAAKQVLNFAGLRRTGIEWISCPTCGRTKVDLAAIAAQAKEALADVREPLRIAIMGCAVNGPGEASEADFGIACGPGEGLLFAKGEIIGKLPESELVSALEKTVRTQR